MKMKTNIIASALLLVLGLAACTKADQEVHHVNFIKLNTTAPEVKVGEEFQMTAELRPADAVNQTIVWACEKEEVATISETGLIKGIGVGFTRITATIDNVTAEAFLAVTSEEGGPTLMELNLDDYEDVAAFKQALMEFDAQGVKEYVLSGDITKVGFDETIGKGYNAFHEAPNVESIDFSACTGWNKLKTKIVLPSIEINNPAMPNGLGKAFNADPGQFAHLRKLVFSPELKVAGRFFIANLPAIEEIIVPGVSTLHKDSFKELPALTKVVLNTSDTFVHGTVAKENPFSGAEAYLAKLKTNCTLYLNANKAPVEGNKYFGVEFKAVVCE